MTTQFSSSVMKQEKVSRKNIFYLQNTFKLHVLVELLPIPFIAMHW